MTGNPSADYCIPHAFCLALRCGKWLRLDPDKNREGILFSRLRARIEVLGADTPSRRVSVAFRSQRILKTISLRNATTDMSYLFANAFLETGLI